MGMKSIVIRLTLVCSLISTGTYAQSDFVEYVTAVDYMELPFNIDPDTVSYSSRKPFDLHLIDQYIEKGMPGAILYPDGPSYHPVSRFKSKSYQDALIVAKYDHRDVRDDYYLIVYDKNGAIISKMIIAQSLRDCTKQITQSCTIDRNHIINCTITTWQENCEKYDPEHIVSKTYNINNNGIITELKND